MNISRHTISSPSPVASENIFKDSKVGNAARPEPPYANPQRFKWLVWSAVVCIVAASLSALWYFYIAKPQSSSIYSGKVNKINIGNVGEYSIFNLIARDKGFFLRNGLDAHIAEYSSGPPAVADLLAGKNDFAIGADFVGVNAIFTHPDLRIISQVSQQFSFSIIARKDKAIASPADLKGKRIGVTKNGAGEFFLGRFLNFNNLLVTDVTEVNLAPAAMVSQITSGQIDAVVIFEPYVYNLQQNLGPKIVTWSAQGEEPTLALNYATQSFINGNPDIVRRYIQSLVEAQTYLENNDQAARQLLSHDMHYSPAYVNYLWPKIQFRLSLEQSMLLSMEDEARFVVQTGTVAQKNIPNYLNYIYFDALSQEAPTSVNIIH